MFSSAPHTSSPHLKEIIKHDNRGLITHKLCVNEQGFPEGEGFFYHHGKLHMVVTFQSGQRHGPATTYYPNGNVQSTMFYHHNHLEGELRHFTEHGALVLVETYKNGQLDGPFSTFHKNGVPHQRGIYKNHLKVGVWEEFDEHGDLITHSHYSESGHLRTSSL